MAHRFYAISSSGYRFPPQDANCSTDFDAMLHARQMLGPDGVIEIWYDARLVGVVGVSFSHWSNAERLQASLRGEEHRPSLP